jgi:anti-anti-sigma factor
VATPFAISALTERGVVRVLLRGDVDLTTLDAIRAQLDAYLDAPGVAAIVVDLSQVAFLDSSGIGALVRAQRLAAAAGRAFHVEGAHGQAAAVLDLVGVQGVLSPSR